ncbi:hypothetical protein HK102_007227, partial [Quaeritorhiza haematococci]
MVLVSIFARAARLVMREGSGEVLLKVCKQVSPPPSRWSLDALKFHTIPEPIGPPKSKSHMHAKTMEEDGKVFLRSNSQRRLVIKKEENVEKRLMRVVEAVLIGNAAILLVINTLEHFRDEIVANRIYPMDFNDCSDDMLGFVPLMVWIVAFLTIGCPLILYRTRNLKDAHQVQWEIRFSAISAAIFLTL